MLLLGDVMPWETELLVLCNGIRVAGSKMQTDLELCLDPALAILGGDARDFYLEISGYSDGYSATTRRWRQQKGSIMHLVMCNCYEQRKGMTCRVFVLFVCLFSVLLSLLRKRAQTQKHKRKGMKIKNGRIESERKVKRAKPKIRKKWSRHRGMRWDKDEI